MAFCTRAKYIGCLGFFLVTQITYAADAPNPALQQQLAQIAALQNNPTTNAPGNLPNPSAAATVPPATAASSNPTLTNAPQLNPSPQPANPPSNPAATALTPGGLSPDDVNNAAFNSMTRTLLPMNSDQIQRLRQLFDQSQFAAAALPNIPARGVISSQFVNLAPGSVPPIVRLQVGMVSVLSFLDETGAPWPIQAYDIGNPSVFNVQWNRSDNTLMFQPMQPYAYGNMAIMLQGMSTPIILTITTGQRVFDARIDFHVQNFGPNAKAPVGVGLPNSASTDLLGVLDGVAPANSNSLKVSGGQAQVWLSHDQLFVRTRYTILSPGWLATLSSPDGMKAYQLPKAPLLLASENGRIIQLKVEGI